ncbi:MAG: hypothetical protein FWE67_15145, partial [Planctomycetaceae bacterium]|nr:hypothetical protein [Planctomycetaceae bacterium]
MKELEALIENINTAIAFPETVPIEWIRGYAQRYTEISTEVSRRMIQCIQHLRAGNIAEGIRLAELQPNLLEMYLLLDFTARDEWIEIISPLGFVIPPLPAEMFRELDDSYLTMTQLEPLLRQHRLHALNGSSVRKRLSIIRAIAKIDIENIFWIEDQELFETERIKEFEKDVQEAIAAKNIQKIRALHQELSTPGWVIPPPPLYRRMLAGSVLRDYADSLMEYFSAYEYEDAKNIYDTMHQIIETEQIPMPPAIQELILPAVQWLNEKQQQNDIREEFDSAANVMQTALEYGVPLRDLERLYHNLSSAAAQNGKIIPAEL